MSRVLSASGYRPDIQGLRAVAVLAVLAYHAGIPGLEGGYLGVDVFFVISGYLIGGQLVREVASSGRLDFAGFYSRRARRILPASLTVIVLTVGAALFLTPPLREPDIAVDGIWSALSGANMRFAIQGTDYLTGTTPSPLQHYWSLGVEEQFYILAPLVIIGLFVALRARPRMLFAAGVLLAVVSFAICLGWGTSSPWTYFALPPRAWELAVGVLAAVVASRVARLDRRWREIGGGLGVVALLASGWLGSAPGFPHPGVGTLIPVLATAALILAGEPGDGVPIANRALGVRPAQFVGTISFSLYLVHWPILELAQENSNSEVPLALWMRVVLALVSFPVALLLWRFVEQPFLRRRASGRRPRRSLIAAAVTTAVLVISLGAAVPALAQRPLTSGHIAPTGVERMPVGTDYVPSNLKPQLENASADTGALYSGGCEPGTSISEFKVCSFGPTDGTTVVLFGDSHAGRWFPALQAAFANRPIRLITLVKSGCRSIESTKLWSGAVNRSCANWRVEALQWLKDHPPQLLILANHLGKSTSPASASESLWHSATLSSLARFPRDVPVAILAETPEFDFSPPVCLSRHLNDANACSESRAAAVTTPDIDGVRSAASQAGATFVDMTNWFCSTNVCPAIVGSTLVYTDEHHVSATFSAQLGPAIYAKLSPLIDQTKR